MPATTRPEHRMLAGLETDGDGLETIEPSLRSGHHRSAVNA